MGVTLMVTLCAWEGYACSWLQVLAAYCPVFCYHQLPAYCLNIRISFSGYARIPCGSSLPYLYKLSLLPYKTHILCFCYAQEAADKKALEDRIITLSRSALKPHYHGGRITAQEYKTIMKKAITKVCCFSELD